MVPACRLCVNVVEWDGRIGIAVLPLSSALSELGTVALAHSPAAATVDGLTIASALRQVRVSALHRDLRFSVACAGHGSKPGSSDWRSASEASHTKRGGASFRAVVVYKLSLFCRLQALCSACRLVTRSTALLCNVVSGNASAADASDVWSSDLISMCSIDPAPPLPPQQQQQQSSVPAQPGGGELAARGTLSDTVAETVQCLGASWRFDAVRRVWRVVALVERPDAHPRGGGGDTAGTVASGDAAAGVAVEPAVERVHLLVGLAGRSLHCCGQTWATLDAGARVTCALEIPVDQLPPVEDVRAPNSCAAAVRLPLLLAFSVDAQPYLHRVAELSLPQWPHDGQSGQLDLRVAVAARTDSAATGADSAVGRCVDFVHHAPLLVRWRAADDEVSRPAGMEVEGGGQEDDADVAAARVQAFASLPERLAVTADRVRAGMRCGTVSFERTAENEAGECV